MEKEEAKRLIALNNRFYEQVAASFSQTRQSPWHGWEQLLPFFQQLADSVPEPQVLDLACGNCRFSRWLAQALPQARCTAVDSCCSLMEPVLNTRLVTFDLLKTLLEGLPWPAPLGEGSFDACVSFGFLHHIPGTDMRLSFLNALFDLVRPGGLVIVSLWRFMNDPRLCTKALQTTKDALSKDPSLALEEGDWLLGWQGLDEPLRYCHHFSETEIATLTDCLSSRGTLATRYDADGRTTPLNSYLVFRKQDGEITSC